MTIPGSKLVKSHQPCPCGKSSDAYSEYSDDHGYCFSCGKTFVPDTKKDLMEKENGYSFQYISWRGISRESFAFYDVLAKVNDNDGAPFALGFKYAYGPTKVRQISEKRFFTVGEAVEDTGFLFGKDKFPIGSAKAITITEGELDAISCFQMMGSKYPSVSVRGASSAKTDCSKDYDYLNSFEKIYICFDNDEPGKKAANEVARLFDFNKVYMVKMDLKDANEYLVSGKEREFNRLWWDAKRFLPEGIISTNSEVFRIIDEDENKPSVPYPFHRLQEMTYGIRLGEFNLIKAMEGIGKTEIFRAFEHHLLKETDENIGIIHLEEGKPRMIKGLVGYELGMPIHLPDSQISKEDIKKGYEKLVRRDERLHIYTHFNSDDPDIILNTIRFMAGPCNCKRIFLDHITLVVTGRQDDDERRALDYISTTLAHMVEDLDFTLFIISHVNDDGKTRGSRNIAKVADLVIDLKRDKMHEDPMIRNTTFMTIEKNRFAGKTGPCGRLFFNSDTYKVEEMEELPT